MKVLHLWSSEKKKKIRERFEQDWSKVSWKEVEMNSLKIKLQKCLYVKGKLNNMEQLQMGY